MRDMNGLEIAYMLPLVILMFWIGLYPRPYLNLMEPTVKHYVSHMQERQQAYLEDNQKVAQPAQPVLPQRTAQTEGR